MINQSGISARSVNNTRHASFTEPRQHLIITPFTNVSNVGCCMELEKCPFQNGAYCLIGDCIYGYIHECPIFQKHTKIIKDILSTSKDIKELK